MYAIISDGSHQYMVQEGLTLEIERKTLPENTERIEFDRVLLAGDDEDGVKIGRPIVDGAKVDATVLGEVKGKKLIIQKYRPRKNSRLKKGHRQKYLKIRIDTIEA